MGFWPTLGIIFLTAVLTWIGHAVLTSQQRKLEISKALEENKRNLYKRFLDLFFKILQTAGKETYDLSEYERSMIDLTRDMTVYASDEVLKLFVGFKQMALLEEHERDPVKFIGWLGKIILEIRKDLGYSATKIQPVDILRTFIKDIDSRRPPQNSKMTNN